MWMPKYIYRQTGSWQGANERGAPGERNAIDMRQNIPDFHDRLLDGAAIHVLSGESEEFYKRELFKYLVSEEKKLSRGSGRKKVRDTSKRPMPCT
jgi:hypothetical protein